MNREELLELIQNDKEIQRAIKDAVDIEKYCADMKKAVEWDNENKKLKKIKQNTSNEIENYDHEKILESLMSAKIKTPKENLDIDSNTYDKIADKCYCEQKSDWNKEDELIIDRIIRFCNDFERSFENSPLTRKDIKKDVDKINNWLKLLKGRIQSQPKQEWNEKDERMLEASINFIKSSPYPYSGDTLRGEISKIEAENWIKFFKERYTWKPSEEQMNAFDAVLVYNPPCSNECRNHLITLYNDLEKLREE